MTKRLYYTDSHLHEFNATVTGCEKGKQGWCITLDRTAFFPEGGGQSGDSGFIGPARVRDTHEKDGEVLHYTDGLLEPGTAVVCVLDWEQRLRRMQNHTGEHILSGLTHKYYGLNNVGFHMGADCMTVDFDGELSGEQLMELESLANETVRSNVAVQTYFPTPEELQTLEYRSKLDLTENVRLVEIRGVDLCACCAPHVSRTGEVGLIKLLDAQRHRGGVRVSLICGMDALEEVRRCQELNTAISRLLSAKRDETAKAVERLLAEQVRQKERMDTLSLRLVERLAESYRPTEGNLCVFDDVLDEIALRELVNRLAEKCTGLAAAFFGSGTSWRYIIGSRYIDLRANARVINAGINGKGGGTSTMIQGRAEADAESLKKFINDFCI